MTSKPTHLARATFAAALLSAIVIMQPVHAGLIGGGGAIGGGLGGGLSGNLGQRSLDVRGNAAGQVQHDAALRRAQTAQAQAAQAATATRSQAEGTAARGASVEAQKSVSLEPRTNAIDANGAAAAQATRGSRSIGAGGSAQTSVRR